MNNIIFFYLNSFTHQSMFLDWLIVFTANTFGYIMIFFAIIFLLFHKDGNFDFHTPFREFNRKVKEIALVFFSGIFAWGISEILKSIFNSPRPFIVFQNLQPLFIHGGMDSFPSGHATFFSALAVSLYLSHKKIGKMYMIVALMVGIARVASGVHFPIDIVAGFVLGTAAAICFSLIIKPKKA